MKCTLSRTWKAQLWFSLIACGLLLTPTPTVLAQQKDVFTPLHVAKIRDVGDVAISPDGKTIAYTLNVPRDLSKENDGTANTELHLVDPQSGKSKGLVTGNVNVGGVTWTPDGKQVAFLQKGNKDKNLSLYLISPTTGKMKKVLEHDTSIASFSFSPDGKQVAFLATKPTPKALVELRKRGFNQEIYEEEAEPTMVWVALVDGKAKPRLLKLPGSASDLHWSPTSDKLAVALAPSSLIDDAYMFKKVRIVDVKTGQILQFIDNPGKMGEVAWSPDGKHLALIAGADKYDPREGRLWVAPFNGVNWIDILPKYMGHVVGIAWRDPSTVLFLGHEGVYSSLGMVKVKYENYKLVAEKAKTILPAEGPVLVSMSVSDDGKHFAFVAETPTHPREVYFMGPKDKAPRRLTDNNPWLNNMKFAKQEVVRHKARDGLLLEGILVRPLNEEKGKKYPLVMTVHGGPESHVPNGWVTRYSNLGQVGAANGMAVFYPNYRGSTGRGVEFSMLGQKDAAGKEFDDIVDAVDHLIATGLVDKNKVGVTGGSYGGFATAWCSTKYSNRFAAGVMFVGISDNVSKVGTTDIPWEMYLVHHRKWLWDDWDYFLKRSPIYYVKQARTPLLIMHGKNDPRVHPGQSLELFRHLKILAKTPVRLVLYPGEGHGNRRAASRLDYNYRLLRWMEHYLKGVGGSPPPIEIDYGIEFPKEKGNASK